MQPNGSIPVEGKGVPIMPAGPYEILHLGIYTFIFFSGLWYLSNKFLIKPGYRDQVSCPANSFDFLKLIHLEYL